MKNAERKVTYIGIELDGLTHGGEYTVARDVVVCNMLLGRVLIDDNGNEQFIGAIQMLDCDARGVFPKYCEDEDGGF